MVTSNLETTVSGGYFIVKNVDTMELKDTIEIMNSEDYKERFKAEYYQVIIRFDGLNTMLIEWDLDELNFQPKCSYELLLAQLRSMETYAQILRERARIEEIEL